jgi:hypothetical protein
MIKNVEKILYNLFVSFIISFIIFALYVEFNPKITNILFVKSSNDYKIIEFKNLFNLMIGPFKYDFYWIPNYFDVNFIIYFVVIFIFVEFHDSTWKIFY